MTIVHLILKIKHRLSEEELLRRQLDQMAKEQAYIERYRQQQEEEAEIKWRKKYEADWGINEYRVKASDRPIWIDDLGKDIIS